MKLIIRWIIIIISLIVAAFIVPGIYVDDSTAWVAFGVMAIILGFVNGIIRPILVFLSCGCIVATMGLFMLVINALTLWFSSWLAVNVLGINFVVDGFLPALLGSIIVSLVSFVLSMFLINDNEKG